MPRTHLRALCIFYVFLMAVNLIKTKEFKKNVEFSGSKRLVYI